MVATIRQRSLVGGGLPLVAVTALTFIAGLGWAGEPRPEPYFTPHGSPVVVPTTAPIGASMPIADPSLGVGDDTSYSRSMAMGALPTTIAAGRTAGTFGVTNSGAASYTIPIWTPPGVATVDLKLALNYSSRGGNGVLGQGWSISGLSAISRCNKTLAQDGVPAAVTNTTSDRFCLDGQQLKLVSGTYGASGSVYATEVESFSRIVASGSVGAGPASFTVTSKNGLIREYGTTTDSRVFAGSSGTVRTWALSRVRDRLSGAGNSIALTYVNEAQNGAYTNGTYRIDSIAYPMTATGQGPFYRVKFNYSPRPTNDPVVGYLAGNVVRELNQLDSIVIEDYATGGPIKSYNFIYQQGATTRHLRLTTVQECSALSCLRPTTIDYQNGQAGWATTPTLLGTAAAASTRILPLDMNGDGVQDLIYPIASGSNYDWQIVYGTSSGTYTTPVSTGVITPTDSALIPGDFAAKGQTDLLYPAAGYWYRLYWNGSALVSVSTGTTINTNQSYSAGANAADVNGDGLPDLVWYYDEPLLFGGITKLYVQLNTTAPGAGVSFAATSAIWYTILGSSTTDWTFLSTGDFWSMSRSINVADFNGDGRADILVHLRKSVRSGCEIDIVSPDVQASFDAQADGGEVINACTYTYTYYWRPLVSTGSSFQEVGSYVRTAVGIDFGFIDWNGDGCTDLYGPSSAGGTYQIYPSLCTAAGAAFGPGIDTQASWGDIAMAADYDGDGKQDLITGVTANGNWKARRSTGDGVDATVIDTGVPVQRGAWFVTDTNGDGLVDLGWADQTHNNKLKLHPRVVPNVVPDLATTFTDGFGMVQQPTYVSIAQSNHTKYAIATFPEADLQVPLVVVNQFTATDGTGSAYQKQFHYYGARSHVQGRGFEGFYAQRIFDSRNGLYTYDYVKQPFPYTGIHTQRSVYQSDGKLLTDWSASVAEQTLGAVAYQQRKFPYIAAATEIQREIDGSAVSTGAVGFQYADGYGNPTQIQITVTDDNLSSPFYGTSWQNTVDSTFANDPGSNCLGLPQTSSTTQVAPGQSTRTMSASYVTDTTLCRVTQQVIEPSVASQKVTTSAGFDACGNLKSISVVGSTSTGAAMPARATSMNFGSRCQLPESITDAMGNVRTLQYSYDFGLPTQLTDPNGLVTRWQYDDFGRRQSERRPDLTWTTWAHESCSVGPCWGVADLRRLEWQYDFGTDDVPIRTSVRFFDGYDRPRFDESHRILGVWTIDAMHSYDSLGRLVSSALPFSPTTNNGARQWTYDLLDRPATERLVQPGGVIDRTTSYAYGGQITTVTNPRLHSQTMVNDVMGRLRRVTDPTPGGTTRYDYDSSGNLARIQDADGFVSTGAYNNHGFMTQWTDADRGAWTFTGNSLNERTAWSNARSQNFSAVFDKLGRITSRTEPEGTSTFVFGTSAAQHNIGQLTSMSGPGYGESRTYDDKGRLATRSVTADQTYTFDYSYNTIGRLDTLTYPASPMPTGKSGARFKVKYGYSFGEPFRIEDVTESTPIELWRLWETNDSSLPTKESLGATGTVTVTSGYRPWTNELLLRQAGASSLNNRQNLAFDWDANGNLTQRQDLLQSITETFGYDSLDRLQSSQRSGEVARTFSYSASGNLTYRSDLGTLAYNSGSHPHAVTSDGSQAYAYDANGNQSKRGTLAQNWASFNLPTRLRAGSYDTQLYYGPEHQRWKQVATYQNGTETTHYVGDGQLEKEFATSINNTQWRHYVSVGTGTLVVSRNADHTESARYLLSDHLGGPEAVLDAQGNAALRESFAPFGARRGSDWRSTTAPDVAGIANTSRRGFTGHEMLDSVGLVHMNGRVYDPTTGRFLSVDPLIGDLGDSQSVNPYAYVGNRPLSFTDPSGFFIDGGCYVWCASVITSITATVRNFLFGGGGPPPPSAMSLPGQSAQGGGSGPCGLGTISAVCTAMPLSGQTVETSPDSVLPSTREIVWEIFVTVTPGVSTVNGFYEAYVVFSDPESGWQERVIATIAIVPGGRFVNIGSKVIKIANKSRRVGAVAARGTTTVIGRTKDLQNLAKGERSLLDRLTPDLGGVKANWARNSGVLREEMRRGLPIRDASPGDTAGPFLNAERRCSEIVDGRSIQR